MAIRDWPIIRHHHRPRFTGRRISATYGKPNLPEGLRPILSTGKEATCERCGQRLIVHDPRLKLAEPFTELED